MSETDEAARTMNEFSSQMGQASRSLQELFGKRVAFVLVINPPGYGTLTASNLTDKGQLRLLSDVLCSMASGESTVSDLSVDLGSGEVVSQTKPTKVDPNDPR